MSGEAVYGRVARVEWLSRSMVRIVLDGPGLDAFAPTEFTDQYVNALFVPNSAPYDVPFDLEEARAAPVGQRPVARRYTVRAWDPHARRLSIDFVAHGDHGTAGRWAQQAQEGDRLQIVGPSGGYAPDPEADWHLLAGDESALPAIAAALERLPAGRTAVAVIVVDGPEDELVLDCPGDLHLTWLHRAEEADSSDRLVATIGGITFPAGRGQMFVHGEAGETRAVRRHLLGARALPKEGASISPYWRRDYPDERRREVKAAWLAEVNADV